ncbi:hypothetical protein EDD36DRAFT_485198 [Exophiala viscosa]|uniref:Uncharacterized protein n=1 Tax=Exophiala viscosa TaxID=2486360 RepID=A0AAN6IEC2_9EURO|nr:hypothetical protein EDD36DRAFT_485198 [Exophiala viscosa]
MGSDLMGNDLSIESNYPPDRPNYESCSKSRTTMPAYRLPLNKEQRDAWRDQNPAEYREWKSQQNRKYKPIVRVMRKDPTRSAEDLLAADRRDMDTSVEHDMGQPAFVKRDIAEAGINARAPAAVFNGVFDILGDGELADEEKQQQLEDAPETPSQVGREPLKELQHSQRPGALVDKTCNAPYCKRLRQVIKDLYGGTSERYG